MLLQIVKVKEERVCACTLLGFRIKTLTCSNQVDVNRLTLKTHGTHSCHGDVVGSSRIQGVKSVSGVVGADVST